jgi:BirA family biotin operon repressor/biotin-[acetyl-CoA-carboxylase] ligase
LTFSPNKIERLEEIGSTNDWLKARLLAGDSEWMAVFALRQTSGRGRYSRTWLSPDGGLYLSVSRPVNAPLFPIHIPIAASVAVCELLSTQFEVPAKLQWPNDILVDGSKLAGVLSELVVMPHGGNAVIVGVGLNVNTAIKLDDGRGAVSLSQLTGSQYDLYSLSSMILHAIESTWKDLDSRGQDDMLTRWRALCETIGASVDVTTAEGNIRGLCSGIGTDFSLILDTASGQVNLVEGDVQRLMHTAANIADGDK